MFGEPRIHLPECSSTQLLLDASMPEGAVATTDHQTAGRGRLDRTWQDTPGAALLCSILVKPPPARVASELTLVAGLATAETIERALGRPAQLKWPNDVLIDGQKVSGGLAESRDGVVVIGIGINVNQKADALPVDARLPAASLFTVDGRTRDVEELLVELLHTLERAYVVWREDGLPALLEDIRERDFLRGRQVIVNGVEGTAAGIAGDGRLVIETATGSVLVASGEVTLPGNRTA